MSTVVHQPFESRPDRRLARSLDHAGANKLYLAAAAGSVESVSWHDSFLGWSLGVATGITELLTAPHRSRHERIVLARLHLAVMQTVYCALPALRYVHE